MPQARDEAGNIWEVDAQGNAVRLVSPAGQVAPADPAKALQLRATEASIANMAADNARAAEAAALAREQANKPPAGYRWSADGKSFEFVPGGPADPATLAAATKPSLTAKERADAIAGYNSATSLDRIIAKLEEQYKAGPGATSGLSGLSDYLPLTANKQFDSTGNAARGTVGQALGFTGGQLNTATEAEAAVGPYLPKAGDRDEVILDKIQRLRDLANDARARSTAILGGVPDQNGKITPLPGNGAEQDRRPIPGVSLNGIGTNVGGMGTPTLPGGGQPYSTPGDIALQQQINAAYASGKSFDELNKISVDAGRPPLGEDYREAVRQRDAGRPYGAGAPPQSGVTGLVNSAAGTAPGAAALSYLDAASFGIPQALAPDAMNALRDARPISSMTGAVGGALAGTAGIGGLAGQTIGRIAPVLRQGGRLGMFGRNLATDAVYGAGYGQVTQGDPLGGAAKASLGSVLGQGAAGLGGKALTGLALTAPAQALAAKNIPLTVGQSFGGITKGIEDRLSGLPVVGDMVRARQIEGLDALNKQALGEALQPIGATVPDARAAGLGQAYDAVSDAYTRATAGRNFPLDARATAELDAVRRAASNLPPDLGANVNLVMRNRIDPAISGGSLTGDDFQQAMRAIRGYRGEATKPGFEADYRDVLTQAGDALRGVVDRQGGADVVSNLANADRAYRNIKTVDRAMTAARNGSRSGEAEVFTPSQLLDSIAADRRKFGGAMDSHPLYGLANAGQQALPSRVPDSGTAGRLATLALPTALGGAGYGVDSLTGGDTGLTTGLILGAALTAGGSKGAQKALTKALSSRYPSVASVGSKIGKRQRMFGAAATPFFIEQQRP